MIRLVLNACVPHVCCMKLIASVLGSIKAVVALFSRPECMEACNDLFQRLINLCNRDPSTLVLRGGRVGVIFLCCPRVACLRACV
jgi:hypothetical protein